MARTNNAQMWFEFFETEEEAKAYCNKENKPGARSYYMRKNHPATYNKWESKDPRETKHFIAFTTR